MEKVFSIDPDLFVDDENTLRKYLPVGFIRHVLKWIPIYPDTRLYYETPAKPDILCITDQGHLMQFDSNKTILRTCNLSFDKLPTKTDRLEIKKFLSSNSHWYIAILFQNSCYIYEQEQTSFKKHEVKTSVKSIAVDDFLVVGSQQLKIVFRDGTISDLITDFNPISPIYNKLNSLNAPNTSVSNALSFQIVKSKQSLDKIRKEVEENEEFIMSSCKNFSKDVGTNFIEESDLVAELIGKEHFRDVKQTTTNDSDDFEHIFKGLKTKSNMFQYCGQPLLVHTLEFAQPNEWKVRGISTNLFSKPNVVLSNKVAIFNSLKCFTKTESLSEIISVIFDGQRSKSNTSERYHFIVQQFENSMIHSHVGEIETTIEFSKVQSSMNVKMPLVDVKEIIELETLDEDIKNNDTSYISPEKLYGVLTLMKKKTVRICSIASELPLAFSSCLKELNFRTANDYPNLYYDLSTSSPLRGIIVIIRNEKSLKLKVDLFAVNDNVLKTFVRKCYLIMPQDSQINLIPVDCKSKNSKLQKQKNCLIEEMNLLSSLLESESIGNKSFSSPKNNEEMESMKNYNERKRKFEARTSQIEIPLEKFLNFQKDIEIHETKTNLSFN